MSVLSKEDAELIFGKPGSFDEALNSLEDYRGIYRAIGGALLSMGSFSEDRINVKLSQEIGLKSIDFHATGGDVIEAVLEGYWTRIKAYVERSANISLRAVGKFPGEAELDAYLVRIRALKSVSEQEASIRAHAEANDEA